MESVLIYTVQSGPIWDWRVVVRQRRLPVQLW
jgi:hypothetical protein